MLLLLPGQCTRPEITRPDFPPIDTTEIPRTPRDHVYYMRSNEGVPPTDSINKWLGSVGLPPGNPWCSAMASYALDFSGTQSPEVRSGLARNFVYQTPNSLHVQAAKVLRGEITAEKGWMVVYQRGNTIYGHNGFITENWSGADGVYISGNTSPPSGGSEFSGGGVWEKPATIRPGSAFRITDFIIIKK